MDRTQLSFFGHGELDRYSLAEVVMIKLVAGLECRKCRKFSVIDIDELSRLHGWQFTLGEVKRAARCSRCGTKMPEILVRSQKIVRPDRGWYPRPPRATR